MLEVKADVELLLREPETFIANVGADQRGSGPVPELATAPELLALAVESVMQPTSLAIRVRFLLLPTLVIPPEIVKVFPATALDALVMASEVRE